MRKTGHYARGCKTTRVGLLVEPDNPQETIKPETKKLADNEQLCDVVDSDPYGIYMNQEESELQYDSYVMKRVILNEKPINFVIDTGSPFTVIPFSFYQKYFNDVPLRQSKRKLYSYGGHELKIKGFIEVNAEIDTDKRNVAVLVIDTGGPPLLGLDLVKNVFKLLCVMESDIQEIIDRNKDIFEGIGFARDCCPINIKLQENAQPVFHRSNPIPYVLREAVNKEIDSLIEQGIVEPVEQIDWATNLVVVVKLDGKSVRLCGNYKNTINPVMKVPEFPIPRIQDIYDSLSGGEIFSTLDLRQGYYQFPVAEEDQLNATVNTPRGLLKFKRLPYGVASGPPEFGERIIQILSGLSGVFCYFDDIIVRVKQEMNITRIWKEFSRN